MFQQVTNVKLFQNLSKRALRRIAPLMTPVKIKAGKTIIEEGELGREFIIIVDGAVNIERDGRQIGKLQSGDYFGELSLLTLQPCVATVKAESDIDVLALSRREFNTLLNDCSQICKDVYSTAQKRRELIKQIL